MTDIHTGDERLGPIEFLAIEFPNGALGADGFSGLLELVDRGVIRLLDLEFLRKRPDGAVEAVPAASFGTVSGLDLAQFDGAASALLTEEDIASVGAGIESGSVAAIVIYEDRSVIPVIEAWERSGARLIGEGSLLPDEVLEALDLTDAARADAERTDAGQEGN